MKKPVFVRDEILALSWHASDNRYPAVILAPVFYYAAERRDWLQGGGLDAMVMQRRFGTLVWPADARHDDLVVLGSPRKAASR